MSNWYKKFAQSNNVHDGYAKLKQELGGVSITGNGANQTVNIMGQSINVRPILEQAISKLQTVLIEKGVKEVNTDTLDPRYQGLAKSNEPGKVHVDVNKIVSNFQNGLPPTTQLDGAQVDPDVKNKFVQEITAEILKELGGTIAHESQHMSDYWNEYKNWEKNPQQGPIRFDKVQEAPGPKFENEAKEKFF